jgi:hypothetical protein
MHGCRPGMVPPKPVRTAHSLVLGHGLLEVGGRTQLDIDARAFGQAGREELDMHVS